ncbi:MAG: exodeoxyribonuclease VII small subunit [Caldilineaceae bacterium]|nr:exodeoxyribonuclease VII small subunit [Caldilineaceae bacterium]MBP8109781.1 exodeoxyribonuclease VII small subunit [Caldilineaceae bacterium]MBP9074575.1 exodeoxyribonuclease VII small subunit [Caldilineaceae bacterium]
MAKSATQPTPAPPSTTEKPPTYETAYARLESVLAQLEGGDLPLEASLALYEEGARLAKICAAQLDEAELRVRQWQPGDETTEFDDWSDEVGE